MSDATWRANHESAQDVGAHISEQQSGWQSKAFSRHEVDFPFIDFNSAAEPGPQNSAWSMADVAWSPTQASRNDSLSAGYALCGWLGPRPRAHPTRA